MAVATKLHAAFHRQSTEGAGTTVNVSTTVEPKAAPSDDVEAPVEQPPRAQDVPDEETQRGVHDMEAVTLSWSKWSLLAIFLNIWSVYFLNAMQSSILDSLIPYLTSAWDAHSLLSVIYIVADTVTAACYVPLAKMMDLWGRAEGFLFMTICATLGMVIMAACNSLPAFCAGYVFYSLGTEGMTFCADVITADASLLKSRGLAYAFTSSPYIITAFAGSKAAEDALDGIGMRWGIGIFAIMFPIVAAPLYFVLKFNLKKAHNQGHVSKERSERTLWQAIWYCLIQFDAVGVLVFSAGLTLFFLAFDISGSAPSSWKTPYIIVMLVVGFVLLCIFILWERYVAPKPLLAFGFLYNRTVVGSCLLDATYQLCYYCWDYYFTSFLQVVNDVSVAEAGYISNIFDMVSGVLLLGVGVVIRRTGRFKWTLWIAVPLYIFSQGLMIYFRRPNQNTGYLIMCQVLISIGGAVFIIVEQLAILAAVDHQHVASVLALLYVVGTIGDAIGATISGVIWQNTYKHALKMYLPESAMGNLDNIYNSLDTQLSYPVGSVTRYAIQEAYAYAQTRMLVVGTGVMALCFVWTYMIRNIDLKKTPQVKGMVF